MKTNILESTPAQLRTAVFFPLIKGEKIPAVQWDTWEGTPSTTHLGIDCRRSGLVVVDLDRHAPGADGVASWKNLVKGKNIPKTFTVKTPNSGYHLYFQAPEGVEVRNSAGKLAPGIDIRGAGGYVVAPGASLGPGKEYRVERDLPLAPLPQLLVDLLTQPAQVKLATPTASLTTKSEGDLDVYQKRALESATTAVLTAPMGTRSDTLNREAHGLGKAGIPAQVVEDHLTQAALSWGDWEEASLRENIHRSWEVGRGKHQPRPQAAHPSPGKKGEGGSPATTHPWQDLDWYSVPALTKRWLALHPGTHFIPEVGVFIHLAGERYRTRSVASLTALIATWCTQEYEGISTHPDCTDGDRGKARSLLSSKKWSEVAGLLKGLQELPAEKLNATRGLLATPEGVRDLRKRETLPYTHSFLELRTTRGSYRPGEATHPLVEAALQAVPQEARPWFLEQWGKALTGIFSPQDFIVFLTGNGSNGKTTVVDFLLLAAGDYGRRLAPEALQKTSGTNFSLGALEGCRLAFADDISASFLGGTTVKSIVTQEKMTIEKKFEQPRTIALEAHTIVTNNRLPAVSETDEGVWRRLRVLPFTHTFTTDASQVNGLDVFMADPRLSLLEELPQEALDSMLTLGITAAEEWLARGRQDMPLPQVVKEATQAWRGATDVIEGWLEACTVASPDYACLAEDARDSFFQYLEENGYAAQGARTWKANFEAHSRFQAAGIEARKGRLGKFLHSQWQADRHFAPQPRLGEGVKNRYYGLRLLKAGEVVQEVAAPAPHPTFTDEALEDFLDEDALTLEDLQDLMGGASK